MPPRIDVLGLGVAAVDDLVYLSGPLRTGQKSRIARRERHLGGLTAYALVAAARLGARTGYAAVLGEGPESDFVLRSLAAEGVAVDQVTRDPEAGPVVSTIAVDPDGTRTIVFDDSRRNGPPDDLDVEIVDHTTCLLVDGHGVPGATLAAARARERGIAVVGDCESLRDPRLPGLLALVDHLVLPEAFALELTGCFDAPEAVDRLWDDSRSLVCVTQGDRGLVFRDRDGRGQLSAFPVTAVDTSGCGDIFHGAYAAALAHGSGMREALTFAAATSAISATRTGGPRRVPSRDVVIDYIRTHRQEVAS